MTEQAKPVLQKPPGYRDPNAPAHTLPKPPPRKAALPSSFHPQKKKCRGCWCRCCCCCCISIIILIALLAVAGGVFYLWFHPRLPVFHLQSLQFSRFNFTVGPDGPALDTQAVVRVEARNPNRVLKLSYEKIVVSLTAENVDLGTATAPAFSQAKKNTTVLKFTTNVKNLLVESGSMSKLREGFRTKNLVVATEVRTGLGVGADGWSTMPIRIKVLCPGLSLKQIENGAVPSCTINLLKWIYIHT